MSYDTFAQIIVTIGIFWLGLVMQALSRFFQKYIARRSLRNFLKHVLLRYQKGLNAQVRSLKALITQITVDHIGNYTFTPINNSASKDFEEIAKKEIFDAFFTGFFSKLFYLVNNKRQLAFNNIISNLSLAVSIEKNLPGDMKDFVVDLNRYNELLNQSRGEVIRLFENFRISLDGKQVPQNLAKYFNSLEQAYVAYRNIDNHLQPKITEEHFIQKVLQINRSSFQEIKDIVGVDFIIDLNEACLLASVRFTNLKSHIETSREVFEGKAFRLLDCSNKIMSSMKILYRSPKKYYLAIVGAL